MHRKRLYSKAKIKSCQKYSPLKYLKTDKNNFLSQVRTWSSLSLSLLCTFRYFKSKLFISVCRKILLSSPDLLEQPSKYFHSVKHCYHCTSLKNRTPIICRNATTALNYFPAPVYELFLSFLIQDLHTMAIVVHQMQKVIKLLHSISVHSSSIYQS